MSKLSIKILAVAFAAVLAAAGYADAKGGGGGGRGGGGGGGHGARGGGHHGGGHFARGGGHRGGHISRARVGGGRHIGRAHVGRAHVSRGHIGRSFAQPGFNRNRALALQTARAGGAGNALNARALARSLRHSAVLNPTTRAQFAAGAAMAGWAYGRSGNGWWQHSNGGYGWVGPLFWPFAYYDFYDYAIWGSGFGAPFWGYGYDDIYAGMFAPYGYNELTRYLPPRGAMARGARDPLAEMCGDDSREVAGLPVDLIEQAVDPTEPQRAALDELAKASVAAAQGIKAACPTTVSLTAPGRLASMQQRIEAMIAGVTTVQPALDKFYGLLTDEQKLRLNALGEEQRKRIAARNRGRSIAETCDVAEPAALQWPAEELQARLHPTDAQRASLAELTDTNARAAKMLRASCPPGEAVTPPARLAAVGKRLDTMLQALKAVRASLEGFYATLNDEQKAQFEAIGPRRTASSDPREPMQRQYRR